MVGIDIHKILSGMLSNIKEGFDDGELAYLGLQSKYEGQIRDKIAWRMQRELDNLSHGKYIVRREWPSAYDVQNLDYSKSSLKGRNKVDLAILEMTNDHKQIEKIIAIIEFKAHMFLNSELWPYEAFYHDIHKMWQMVQLSSINNSNLFADTELYYVFLHGSTNKKNCDEYASAVQYKDILDNSSKTNGCNVNPTSQTFKDEMKKYWQVYYNSPFDCQYKKHLFHFEYPKGQKFTMLNPIPQNIGTSFGYTLYVVPMLWGPVKYDELDNFSES